MLVVPGQVGGPLVQGDQAGGGDHPRLPHAAAEHLPHPPRLPDPPRRAAEEGAHRRPQPLGERDHHRRDGGREARHRHPQGRRGVERAGAVQVEGEVPAASEGDQGVQLLGAVDGAAGDVVTGLGDDQGGPGAEAPRRRDDRLDGGRVELPPRGVDHPRQEPRERRHAPHLVVEHVGAGVADRLAAGEAVEVEGDLVAHGAGRDVERRLLPGGLGPPLLQAPDRRVLPHHVVPYLRLRHRTPHRRRRAGHGVRAEIDVRGRWQAAPLPGASPPAPPRS